MKKIMIVIISLLILSLFIGQTVSVLATSKQNYNEEKDSESNQLNIKKTDFSYTYIEDLINNQTNIPFKFKMPRYVPGEMIVKFKEETQISIAKSSNGLISTGIKSIDTLNNKYLVTACEKIEGDKDSPELSNIYKLELDESSELFTVAEDYGNDSSVEFAHPNYIMDLYDEPNDPYFDQQWALKNTGQNGGTPGADIDATDAWNTTKGSSDVVIAIIDTGVDYNHPDLSANIWSNNKEIPGNGIDDDNNGYVDDIRGWNFKDKNNDPMDYYGHGTHCAGIAAAVIDNGVGIAGIAGHCKIMPLEILTVEDVSNAISYAVNNGADIISMSIGITDFLKTNQTMIMDLFLDWAYAKGVVEIAAAGNDGFEIMSSPASNKNVIAVTATDNNDNKAYFTSYGLKSEVAAPGVDIYSTVWQDSMYALEPNLWINNQHFDSNAFAYTGTGNVTGSLTYVGLGTQEDLQGVNLTGKIALIERGGDITFAEKVDNVYSHGAIGAVIFNCEPDNFLGTLVEYKQIPVVSISGNDGFAVLYLLGQGPVNATISIEVNPYVKFSGTSMACPTVAGVAALVLSRNPDLSQNEVRTILRSSFDPVYSDCYIGMGRINASEAVEKAKHIVAQFDNSLKYDILSGNFNIKGTAKGLDFDSYTIEYSNSKEPYPSEESWVLIGGSDKRKTDQTLISWDTTKVLDGPYALRLKVLNKDNQVYMDRSYVIVDNIAQTFEIDQNYTESTPGWGYDHFNNIQSAIDVSGEKDQILVHSGTYTSDFTVDHRKVTINGENVDNTILNCNITINRCSMSLSNFTFNKYGIGFLFSSDNTVSNCKFIGIQGSALAFLFTSSRNKVINNYINTVPIEGNVDLAFALLSNDNTISNNIIVHNGIQGIMGFNRNKIFDNQLDFIWLTDGAQLNDVYENTISNGNSVDGSGIVITWGRFNNIHDNKISNLHSSEYDSLGILIASGVKIPGIINYGDSSFNNIKNNNISYCDVGILLTPFDLENLGISKTKNNLISCNQVSNCEYGLYLMGATNNVISKNTIQNNGNGIKIVTFNDDSYSIQANNNSIYQNDFVDNSVQAFDECSNTWYQDLLQEGNFWSDYTSRYPDAQVINRILRPDVWSISYDINGGANSDIFPLVDQYNNQVSVQLQGLLNLLSFASTNKLSILKVILQDIQSTAIGSEQTKSSYVSTIIKPIIRDTSTSIKSNGTSGTSGTTSNTGDSVNSGTGNTKTPTGTNSGTDKPSTSSGGGKSSGNQNAGDNKPTNAAN
jgi:parallel beta-helix repeat protein